MIYVLRKNKKNITIFHLKIIILKAVKYCCILHRRVIVMSIFTFKKVKRNISYKDALQTKYFLHFENILTDLLN